MAEALSRRYASDERVPILRLKLPATAPFAALLKFASQDWGLAQLGFGHKVVDASRVDVNLTQSAAAVFVRHGMQMALVSRDQPAVQKRRCSLQQ